MFSSGREYRVIVARSPSITKATDAFEFLNTDYFLPLTKPIFSSENVAVYHTYYYRKEPLSPSHVEKDELKIIWHGLQMFKYNFYISTINIENQSCLTVLSAPFSKMAKEIFDSFKSNSKGNNVTYIKIDIEKLINKLSSNIDDTGNLLVTKLAFEIEGDSLTKTATLGGTDVPNSHTFDCFLKSLKDLILRYRKVRISYTSKENSKTIIEFDRFGNYIIPIHSKGRNLKLLEEIFTYLFKENVAIDTPLLPFFTGSK